MSNPYVFIVGCPRSGTTLLRRMVDAHPSIAIVPEIGWLARRYEERIGLDRDGYVQSALAEELSNNQALGRYAALPVTGDELNAVVRGRRLHYRDLVAWLFDRYGEDRGKPLVGNKTVDLCHSVGTLHGLFGSAKIIHLIRDGRDVAASAVTWRRAEKLATRFATWRQQPLLTAALWWEWHVTSAREQGLPLGARLYYELRYEALVADPAGECARLCDFLSVPYDDAMIHFHEGRTGNVASDAKHGWLPPTPGLRDWRHDLAPEDCEKVEAVAGDLLSELGYDRAYPDPSAAARQLADAIRPAFGTQALVV